jgi:recombination protein RecT
MATQLAEHRPANPVDVFRQTLSTPAMREQIKMALPNHIPVERFERVSLTAVQQNPDLLNPQKVERRSLFGALVRAAQDGLLPDGREGAIVPFKGKAQWMPMVAGVMKKVRNSGEIASWETSAVYEKDTFERLLGDDQRIYHKPYEDGDPGKVIGAYSIVTFKDGTKSRDYMPRWRIERAREQNPIGKNSLMWTKFYDEGAIKTVIRHHSKRLPMSTDVEAIFERDETMSPAANGGYVEPEREPAPPQLSRLDAIEHQIADDEPAVEPEVITEQAEEIEAEIEQPEAAAQTALADQLGLDDPAAAKADELIAAMDAAPDAKVLEKLIGEAEKHKPAMPDELQMKLEVAYSRNRGRVAEGAEA